MNRHFYFLANLFLGLSFVIGVYQSIIFILLGPEMSMLQPYVNWVLITNIIFLISSAFMLRYFHQKNYRSTFLIATVYTVVQGFAMSLLYLVLIFVARQLFIYVTITGVISLVIAMVYSLTLIISIASERPWLKASGFFTLIVGVVLLLSVTWSMMSPKAEIQYILEKVVRWTTLLSSLTPAFFMINFVQEEKKLVPEDGTGSQPSASENLLAVTGMISIVLVVLVGIKIGNHSYWRLDWKQKGPTVSRQLAASFESRTFENEQGNTLRYLLMKPVDYDPQKQYPLVVCLHGGPVTFNADSLPHVEVPEPAPLLSSEENKKRYPAFILVPQCPPGHTWGGFMNLPSVDSLVFEIIETLEKEFSIDTLRRYVAGGSMGGYGSWYFVSTRPEIFAAAIPICGSGNPELAHNMSSIPVWAFHGTKDRNVPVSGSRKMVEAIKQAGGNPRYTEFSGVGHNVWPSVVDEAPDLLDWLFAQKSEQ